MCENWVVLLFMQKFDEKIYISGNIVQLVTFLIFNNLKRILGSPINLTSWQFNINDMELATQQCVVDNLVNTMTDDLKQIVLGKLMKWMSI